MEGKQQIRNHSLKTKKRKAGDIQKRNTNKRPKTEPQNAAGAIVNVDQLSWKKVSLQNDEFDDFEEIEGVDIEYVKKEENDVIQFKVSPRNEPY